MYILRTEVWKLKNILLQFMTTSHNIALKLETSCTKRVVNSIQKLEMHVMLVCMFGLFILR